MKNLSLLCTCACITLFASNLFADPTVRVRVYNAAGTQLSSTDYASGSNVTVALGNLSEVCTVHIYSVNTLGAPSSTLPDAGVGMLVLTGSASASARVNLLIADGDQTFPSTISLAEALTPGVTTFGGFSDATTPPPPAQFPWSDSPSEHHDYDADPWAQTDSGGTDWTNTGRRGLIIPNPSLRRQTVVAAVVSQDICPNLPQTFPAQGRIEAGQILRLSALGTIQGDGSVLYGNINAHVIAVGRDDYLSYDLCNPPGIGTPQRTGFRAIESVTAGNKIKGSVIAWGRSRDDVAWSQTPGDLRGRLYERSEAHPVDPPQDMTLVFDSGEPVHLCSGGGPIPWVQYPLWIQRGSIFNIRIGPSETAEGFFGDITSQLGRIYSVRSTGEISGNQIKAADGVLEVRIHKWGQGSAVNQSPIDKPLTVTTISASSSIGLDANNHDLSSVQKVGNDPGDDYEETLAKARAQGAIHLIETKGEFAGSVECDNLIDNGPNGPRDSRGRAGLIVWDGLQHRQSISEQQPSVHVRRLAHNVCILAPSFQSVVIGWQLKGSVVAYGSQRFEIDPGNTAAAPLSGGVIHELYIGKSASQPDATEPNPQRYAGMLPGFVGGFRPPVSLDPADPEGIDETPVPWILDQRFLETDPPLASSHAMLWDHDRWLWCKPLGTGGGVSLPEEYARDGGGLDSVIRAEQLIEAKTQIFGMHQRVFEDDHPKHEQVVSWYRPRVEAPLFGALEIPSASGVGATNPFYKYAGIFEGVVWSGAVEYLPVAPGGIWNHHLCIYDRYAGIAQSAYVQRIGPGGDVWGKQLGLKVGRDMCGELHATDLSAGTKGIWIGSRLGTVEDWGYPAFASGANDPARQTPIESTPRGRAQIGPTEQEGDFAPAGGVYVGLFVHQTPGGGPTLYDDVNRLEQESGVLVNMGYQADLTSFGALWDPLDSTPPVYNSPETAWTGFVRVGDPWADPAARIYTLAPNTPFGTHPEPDGVFDIARRYRRHSWDLSGLALRTEKRAGGSVGVLPYHLHLDDSAPTLNQPGAPSDPLSYTAIPVSTWIQRWPLLGGGNSTAGDAWGSPSLKTVRLRFYGPILATTDDLPSADLPVTVWEWVETAGVFDWEKLPLIDSGGHRGNNFFDYLLTYCDLYLGPRCGVAIRPGMFKVTLHDPVSDALELRSPNNGLRCASFTSFGGLQLGVYEPAPFEWYFRLYYTCADIGQTGGIPGSDGVFDNNDFVVFIDWFFGHNAGADVGTVGGVPGPDGAWDNNDFVVFIDMFFAQTPCDVLQLPCTPGPGLVGGGGGGSGNRAQGGSPNRMGQGQPDGPEGAGPDPAAAIRAALEQMIAAEPPGPRRDQLLEMLNALPPAQP